MGLARTKPRSPSCHKPTPTPSLFESLEPPPPEQGAGRRTKPAPRAVPAGDGRAAAPQVQSAASAAPADAGGAAKEPGCERRASGVARRTVLTAEVLAGRQREISVSEFFAKNRHLLGFDNKRKALLTTVKEAVDNALDACEEAGILPEVHVLVDQLAEERFRVTVRDNGPGIVRAQIPNIFGKLLYGSKFHRLKMARGQQGIGISAAGLYGLLTTGKPIHVTSRTGEHRPAHHFQIQIDTSKNRPDVVKDEEQDWDWPRGTEVAIELIATYSRGRQSVDEYIELTAIANPHARLFYRAPGGAANDGAPVVREFPRASQELPAETREIQPHPHGIELGVLMKMLKDAATRRRGEAATKRRSGRAAAPRTLAGFLQNEFSRVTARVAHEICTAAGLSPQRRPADLEPHDVEKLYQAMQSARIMAPPTDCLAPIGVRGLLAGLLKEVKAEFYTAVTRDAAVYRGNPFLIEVGLAYGGALPADEPARVFRFANRVPLLYQQSACAAYKSVLDVEWRNYGLSQPAGSLPIGPLVVMLHMASVWVPFTSESKEAIADYDEIRREMKLALQECGRKLSAYLRRRRRQRLEGERRSIFERYVYDVADALASMTGDSRESLMRSLQGIARRRTAEADVVFDEDGRPAVRGAAEVGDELAGDESTVIVEENAPPADAEAGLFDGAEAATPPPRATRRRQRTP